MKLEADNTGSFFMPDRKQVSQNGNNSQNGKNKGKKVLQSSLSHKPKPSDIKHLRRIGIMNYLLLITIGTHNRKLGVNALYDIYSFKPNQQTWIGIQVLYQRGWVVRDKFKKLYLTESGEQAYKEAKLIYSIIS